MEIFYYKNGELAYLKACKHCGRSYTTKAASNAHEPECNFSPQRKSDAKNIDQGKSNDDQDPRGTGFERGSWE